MRMVLGIVSLVLVLAVVGKLASTQLGALRSAPVAATGGNAPATVPEQSRQIQERMKTDITQALEQGAAARRDEPGQ